MRASGLFHAASGPSSCAVPVTAPRLTHASVRRHGRPVVTEAPSLRAGRCGSRGAVSVASTSAAVDVVQGASDLIASSAAAAAGSAAAAKLDAGAMLHYLSTLNNVLDSSLYHVGNVAIQHAASAGDAAAAVPAVAEQVRTGLLAKALMRATAAESEAQS